MPDPGLYGRPGTGAHVPFAVTLDEHRTVFTLTVPTGTDALGYAAADDPLQLFPGSLTPEHRRRVLDRLADPQDVLDRDTCTTVVDELADLIYAVPWWAATRLAATAHAHWSVYTAWAASNGFDPLGRTAAHVHCGAIRAWIMGSAKDEKEARRLDAKIFHPPRRALDRTTSSTHGDFAAFSAQLDTMAS